MYQPKNPNITVKEHITFMKDYDVSGREDYYHQVLDKTVCGYIPKGATYDRELSLWVDVNNIALPNVVGVKPYAK